MATCYNTKNYDLFKFKNNRPIYPNHVDAIAADKDFPNSFEYHPAVVNKDFLIIDGQHRILAAQKMKIPAWYVIQKDADETNIMSCNINQKQWTYSDYIEFYCKKGNKTYIFLKELSETHKLSVHMVIRICQHFGNNFLRADFNKQFKNGTLVFKNLDMIRDFITMYAGLIKKMTKEKGCESVKFLRTRTYCTALMNLFKSKSSKLPTILRKIPDFWKKMVAVNQVEQAFEVLEKIRVARNSV